MRVFAKIFQDIISFPKVISYCFGTQIILFWSICYISSSVDFLFFTFSNPRGSSPESSPLAYDSAVVPAIRQHHFHWLPEILHFLQDLQFHFMTALYLQFIIIYWIYSSCPTLNKDID